MSAATTCPNRPAYPCLRCDGTGKDPEKRQPCPSHKAEPCYHCQGSGREPCEDWCACRGSGIAQGATS